MMIVHASSELHPFARTGGLGDVVAGILKPLAQLGHRVAAITPLYRRVRDLRLALKPAAEFDVNCAERARRVRILKGEIPGSTIPAYFVEEDSLFDRDGLYGGGRGDYPDNAERFGLFSKAVLEALSVLDIPADVVHAHDWQTALIPVYLKTAYRDHPAFRGVRSVFTIHNIAYQGLFPSHFMQVLGLDWSLFNWKQLEFWGHINFLKGGLVYADRLTTVSPRYAREIQTEEFGCGLEGVLHDRAADLTGILNGVDTDEWNPSKDRAIPARYSAADLRGKAACKAHLRRKAGLPDAPVPLFGIVSRLVEHKGIDLLGGLLNDFVATESQLVVLGQGEDWVQRMLVDAANRWPRSIATRIGFDATYAHEITAGADMLLMPSRAEPCGLSQMYAQLYGTLPVARRTGGLADTIRDGETGFLFDEPASHALLRAIRRAVEAWRQPAEWGRMAKEAMKLDWSWARSAKEYAKVYEGVAGR
jgi:starch synthase